MNADTIPLQAAIGQTLMARHAKWRRRIDAMLRKGWLGGVMIGYGEAWENMAMIRAHTAGLREISPYPLIIAAPDDCGLGMYCKPGAGGAILPHVSPFTPKSPRYLRARQRFICEEAALAGIDLAGWVYLDVAEVEGCEIGDVAYARDAETVSKLGLAAFQGARDANALACGCHFIGLGGTDVPSHRGDEIPSIGMWHAWGKHLLPWLDLIEAGLPAVFTAHVWVRGLDLHGRPVTLSKACLTDFLKGDLNFQGCVIADSLAMHAISKHFTPTEAAIEALNAGCDMILCDWNIDPLRLFSAILAAVQSGALPEPRIRDAARRVIAFKEGASREP